MINTSTIKKGFTLLYSMLVVSAVLTIALVVADIVLRELLLSSTIRDSQKAFYAADSGVECALYWDQQHVNGSAFGGPELPPTLRDGLTGHWKMDETSGTNVPDSSQFENPGTVAGSGYSWVAGRIANALTLGAANVQVPEPTVGPELYDLGAYTYAFWIKPAAPTGGWRQVIVKGTGGVAGQRSPGIWLRPSDMGVHFQHSESEGSQVGISDTVNDLNIDEWNHVAVTSTGEDGGIMSIYINGEFDSSITHSKILIPNDSYIRMGASFVDQIDDVRVYNRDLDGTEIAALALNAQFAPPLSATDPGTIQCNSEFIDRVGNWTVAPHSEGAITTFEIGPFTGDRCATVSVDKRVGSTIIDSRGYNTCNDADPRRVERGLRAIF